MEEKADRKKTEKRGGSKENRGISEREEKGKRGNGGGRDRGRDRQGRNTSADMAHSRVCAAAKPTVPGTVPRHALHELSLAVPPSPSQCLFTSLKY